MSGVKRFMKNVNTDVVFPFHDKQIKKPNMFECDAEGTIMVENQAVGGTNMIEMLETLAAEKKAIKAKLDDALKQLKEYKEGFGPLDSKLPDSPALKKQKAAKAEAEAKPAKAKAKDEVEKAEAKPVEAPPTLEVDNSALLADVEKNIDDEPVPTKAALAKALFEENGIKVNTRNYSLDDLIVMKDDADKASPEEIDETLLK